jgi:hypothetical protein
MQNKANLLDAQMNVNLFITKDYRKYDAFVVQKNKANSKPNKANFKNRSLSAISVAGQKTEGRWQSTVLGAHNEE